MKKKLPFFFFCSSLSTVSAQDEILENNPPSLHWYQVTTPGFRVLFPEGFEQQAQRMANTLQHIHDAESKSLGSSPRKISVLLQNQSSVSEWICVDVSETFGVLYHAAAGLQLRGY